MHNVVKQGSAGEIHLDCKTKGLKINHVYNIIFKIPFAPKTTY